MTADGLTQEPTLRVRDLKTQFFTKAGIVKAVDGISFDVYPGPVLGGPLELLFFLGTCTPALTADRTL